MVKIYTFSHKRPDFLDLQLKSFRKNLEDDFEFIVFNNAAFDLNKKQYNEIKNFCDVNKLQCIDIQKDADLIRKIRNYDHEEIFNADGGYINSPIACAYPLCYAWEKIISKTDDMICIIDSDMFFVEKENISAALNQYDIIYMPQSRGPSGEVNYMWNGLCFMNLKNMPEKETLDWWCGYVNEFPVDVGGHTHHYFIKHLNNLKSKSLAQHYVGEDPDCDFSPANYEYFDFSNNKSIIHYRGGSNWDLKSNTYHNKKTQWLINKLSK